LEPVGQTETVVGIAESGVDAQRLLEFPFGAGVAAARELEQSETIAHIGVGRMERRKILEQALGFVRAVDKQPLGPGWRPGVYECGAAGDQGLVR